MTLRARFFCVAPLLFASGFCALIYQTTWLREFRLIFGASTAATAAVLGIFMGGIGLGSAILGRRAEVKARPLEFYARLEFLIAMSAAATPFFIWGIRRAYLAMGGTLALGLTAGTIVRLLLAALAIGLPTFLMGGTLPAVVRVVATVQDANRRCVALLYGINTLGAVAGAAAGTFYFFEAWGNHFTIGIVAALNILVGLAALWISRILAPIKPGVAVGPERGQTDISAPPRFVLVASAGAGFVFLLMELVWYRMLCPLLGGSTFTFGLILAIALFGIGLGGLVYAFFIGERRITLNGFAFVCALEALFTAIPYALGDRIAVAAMLLRPLGSLGFYGHVIAWSELCALVILPAALISGIQFPMLIALLGKGDARVGVQTGTVYAWNTAGAIAGSLAGGFGLLPALSAPGTWRFVVILLCTLATAAVATDFLRRSGNRFRGIPALGAAVFALCLLTALGPTAFWRHSQIGVGRLAKFTGSKSSYHDMENAIRRDILWDADGVESSVALSYSHGINFVVNGRCDGHAQGDGGTQIMSGLIPAALHPEPKRALVVGLGTGSTAGWLGAVPSIQQVDVVELEPAIVRVAEACLPVNHQVLNNPKVHVIIGDGREVLLSARQKYDIIASEPSNPYRAGIACLFTREYYQAAASRLNSGGFFAQWMQAYEVDTRTVETVYSTLGSVFPNIDTWQTAAGDLLFVASAGPAVCNASALRKRLAEEPFKSAILHTWGVTDLEGFLAHFVADNSLALAMQRVQKVPFNTDDRTVLEFAFARNVDVRDGFQLSQLRSGAKLSGADRLDLGNGGIDWKKVDDARFRMVLPSGETSNPENSYSKAEDRSRAAAYASYAKGDLKDALEKWRASSREANDLYDQTLLAECLADEGDSEAFTYIAKIRPYLPIDADSILAHYFFRKNESERAIKLLESVFSQLHTYPWQDERLTQRTIKVAEKLAESSQSDTVSLRLYAALRSPFSIFNNEEARRISLFQLGARLDKGQNGEYSLAAIEAAEPYVPWQLDFLKGRKACYEAVGSPRLARAERDLREFVSEQPARLDSLSFMREIPAHDAGGVAYGLEH